MAKLIKEGESAIDTLDSFQTLLSYQSMFLASSSSHAHPPSFFPLASRKYRMMEAALRARETRYDASIAEIESSLEAVETLRRTPTSLSYNFELGSTLYATAIIPPTESHRCIGLWLGGGIMLEFEVEEAISFLKNKLEERQRELSKVKHDLLFIRRQVTTMEVNMARLYNHNRSQRVK